jgi:hypothetical protein
MTRTNLFLATLATALVAGTAFAYGPRYQEAAAPSADAARSQVRQQLHEPGTAETAEMRQIRQQLHEPGTAEPAEATQARGREQVQDAAATATRQQARQQFHDPAECDAEEATQTQARQQAQRADGAGAGNPDAPGKGQGRGTPRGGRS